MPARKLPAWTSEEVAILSDVYPRAGIQGAADALPDRGRHAIYAKASKLQLRSPVVSDAPKPKLQSARLEEAIRLREVERWSFARIGAALGVCEASACNAVMIALCPRQGFTPAARDEQGQLKPEGLERLRLLLRKRLKAIDIQLRLGVSASCISEQRRRYEQDLKARGKAPLPPPGGGEPYSGVNLPVAKRRAVEQLLLDGFGAKKVSEKTGVSNTSVGRIRNRLIRRLARRGQTLPGCDADGVRHVQRDSTRHIPPGDIAELHRRLLAGEPVQRAARACFIGQSSAYRIRDRLAAELAADGRQPLPAVRRGSDPAYGAGACEAAALPGGARSIYRFRQLCRKHPRAEAEAILRGELGAEQVTRAAEEERRRKAEAARPRSFEEQLARVAAGARLVARTPLRRADPNFTLGGVATGAL